MTRTRAAAVALLFVAAAPCVLPLGAQDAPVRRRTAFAAANGGTVPTGAEADRLLERRLLLRVAFARWGSEGYYRLSAQLDPDVERAREAFARAEQLLAGS